MPAWPGLGQTQAGRLGWVVVLRAWLPCPGRPQAGWVAGLRPCLPSPGRPQAGWLGWVAGWRVWLPSPGRGKAGSFGPQPGLRARPAGLGRAEAGLPAPPLCASTDRPAWPAPGRAQAGLPVRRKRPPTAQLLGRGIYTPPPTFSHLARPSIEEHHYCKLKTL